MGWLVGRSHRSGSLAVVLWAARHDFDIRGAWVRWVEAGWGTAFEVLAGYQAPSQACGGAAGSCASHKLAYLVAVLGYVFVPAFIGAIAALFVDLGVRRHGPLSATDVEKLRRRIFEER